MTDRPTICLSMIVRDEAHVVLECLESVAPVLDHWVVVDTGSHDDTPALVEGFFAAAGIPGTLVHRPWRDFATNRTEALGLCRGRADYALVMDADDVLVGTPDLAGLTADGYLLHLDAGVEFWRPLLLRLDRPWRYEGVVHEYAVCDAPDAEVVRLGGGHWVLARRQGARSRDPETHRRDAALLAAAVEADPADTRSTFYLAQSHHDVGDLDAAVHWYRRRAAMGGWDEEVFYARLRVAQCLLRLGRPRAEVVEAYHAAWQTRPHRAEPLVALARLHREAGEHHLAHLYAERAADLPFPEGDLLFVDGDDHRWRALDELAVSAFWVGRHAESFAASCRLLDGPHLPDDEWERVLANRDHALDTVWERTLVHPTEVVERLVARGPVADPEVTFTITAGRRPDRFEATMDSFLNCCADLDRIGRWVCVAAGAGSADLDRLARRYPFLEFVEPAPGETGRAGTMEALRRTVASPWWLHLEDDWHVVVPGRYVARAIEVLEDDPRLGQVLFNRNYAEVPTERSIVGGEVRRTASGRRYRRHVHHPAGTPEHDAHLASLDPPAPSNTGWPHFALRPSMLRTAALAAVGPFREADPVEREYADRYVAAGWRSAFFDQVMAVRLGPRTIQGAARARPGPDPVDRDVVPIHVIVPVRDQWPYTRSIVEQVLAEPVASLTVFDNGSTDGTPERLAAIDDPRLRVLARPDASLHEMWNEGWRAVLPGPAALAVLNNDITMAPGSLPRLRDALYADDDLWVVYPDHRRTLTEGDASTGSVTATEGTFAGGGMSGFCFVLRAEAHAEGLPLFDEGFEWWYGDDDLVRNVTLAGKRVGRLDGLPVEHAQEGTAKTRDLSAVKDRDRRRWEAKVAAD